MDKRNVGRCKEKEKANGHMKINNAAIDRECYVSTYV